METNLNFLLYCVESKNGGTTEHPKQESLPLRLLPNLYYIFVRGGCTEAGEAAEAACGVPLGPG